MQITLLGDDLEFPDVTLALDEPNGLLAVGGDLSVSRLIQAYQQGIFPWFSEGEPILWWSPNPRAVLYPHNIHISKSSRKYFKKSNWQVSIDTCFSQVIKLCGSTRSVEGTWITPEMERAYIALHKAGFAHSLEIWQEDELIGGLYGVSIGRAFFGESMFSTASNASKAAVLLLRSVCERFAIEIIDCQVESEHLASLGAINVERDQFIEEITRASKTQKACTWYADKVDISTLLL